MPSRRAPIEESPPLSCLVNEELPLPAQWLQKTKFHLLILNSSSCSAKSSLYPRLLLAGSLAYSQPAMQTHLGLF